jgi:hypothetical protein
MVEIPQMMALDVGKESNMREEKVRKLKQMKAVATIRP